MKCPLCGKKGEPLFVGFACTGAASITYEKYDKATQRWVTVPGRTQCDNYVTAPGGSSDDWRVQP